MLISIAPSFILSQYVYVEWMHFYIGYVSNILYEIGKKICINSGRDQYETAVFLYRAGLWCIYMIWLNILPMFRQFNYYVFRWNSGMIKIGGWRCKPKGGLVCAWIMEAKLDKEVELQDFPWESIMDKWPSFMKWALSINQ